MKHFARPFLTRPAAVALLALALSACGRNDVVPDCSHEFTRSGVESLVLQNVRADPLNITGRTADDAADRMSMETRQALGIDPDREIKQQVRLDLSGITAERGSSPEVVHHCRATMGIRAAAQPDIELHTFPIVYDVVKDENAYSVRIDPSTDLAVAQRVLTVALLMQRAATAKTEETELPPAVASGVPASR